MKASAPTCAIPTSAMAALVLLATTGAMAPATTASPRALARAVERYERAQISGDRAALGTLLPDDYLLVTGVGDHEDKQAFIADLTAPDFKLEPYVIQEPVRRLWSSGAVVAGIARQRGTSGGKPFDGCIRYADVWKLTRAGWQVALTHVSRMAAPGPAGCPDH